MLRLPCQRWKTEGLREEDPCGLAPLHRCSGCRKDGWSGYGEEEGEPGAQICLMGTCEGIRGTQQQESDSDGGWKVEV